jgi:hypothetical protein
LKTDGGQLTCRNRSDLAVEFAYALTQRTKVVPQAIQQTTKACRQTVIRIFTNITTLMNAQPTG